MIYRAFDCWVAGLLPLTAKPVFKSYFVGDLYWDVVFPADGRFAKDTFFVCRLNAAR